MTLDALIWCMAIGGATVNAAAIVAKALTHRALVRALERVWNDER